MPLAYDSSFVSQLADDIGELILQGGDSSSIRARLDELTCANSPRITQYWKSMGRGVGVPDSAFKNSPPYLFADQPPVRTFRTSGTTGTARGQGHYSPRGLELMKLSIVTHARRRLIRDLDHPVILRFVPSEQQVPEMIMAHGMECISAAFGHPELSTSLWTGSGFDLDLLQERVAAAQREGVPVVLIGGSFGFVNACEALEAQGRRLELPPGSRMLDAGGFKGRSRVATVEQLRSGVQRSFGVDPKECINLFGMTELASQLYDGADVPVGPIGERPKARTPFVWPQVRDAHTLELREEGEGLLEVVDLCILDRPCAVLTGDRGIAHSEGVAIAGRLERGESRGCSLALDPVPQETPAHA